MAVHKDKKAKNKKWYFDIELGKDEKGNRKRKRVRGFNRKKDAENAWTKMKNEISEGTFIERNKTLMKEHLNTWVNTNPDITLQTKKLYERYIVNHINPELGNIEISKLSPKMIQNFVGKLNEKGLASGTVKRIFNVVHASLNTAYQMELINKNVASKIKKPVERRTKEIVVWDIDQVKYFLNFIEGKTRYAIAFKIALHTGMRQGEILGLRWKDIDFQNKMLSIRQTVSHDGKLKHGAKTKLSVRTIYIGEYLLEELKNHKKLIDIEKYEKGANYQNYDLVIGTSNGAPSSPRNLLRVFYSLIKQTNLPKIRFHDLRHTYASLALMAGINIKQISENLGHSSVKITLDTYSHLLPNMKEEATIKFNKLFED